MLTNANVCLRNLSKVNKILEQAGAELCQAQDSLSYSPISWNLATQKLGAS